MRRFTEWFKPAQEEPKGTPVETVQGELDNFESLGGETTLENPDVVAREIEDAQAVEDLNRELEIAEFDNDDQEEKKDVA